MHAANAAAADVAQSPAMLFWLWLGCNLWGTLIRQLSNINQSPSMSQKKGECCQRASHYSAENL